MKIDLQMLRNASVDSIPFSGEVDLRKEVLFGGTPFQSPVRYSGEITNRLDVLRLRGTVETTYHTACARCLKPLEIPLSISADMLLLRGEDGQEDEDVFIIEGDGVDPEDALIPALLLEVDMVYLCKPDCKGLCPHCGVDRNVTCCDCGEKQIDDRLAVLKNLLDHKRDNESTKE